MQVIAFMIIVSSTTLGFAGVPFWSLAITAPALALVSVIDNRRLYARAASLGTEAGEAAMSTMLLSFGNAAVATGGAYLFGSVLRII